MTNEQLILRNQYIILSVLRDNARSIRQAQIDSSLREIDQALTSPIRSGLRDGHWPSRREEIVSAQREIDQAAPPRWRHKKRGTTYTVIGRGKLQISDETIWKKNHGGEGLDTIARTLESMDFVIYRADSDGSLWVRPAVEFDDGRFELLA